MSNAPEVDEVYFLQDGEKRCVHPCTPPAASPPRSGREHLSAKCPPLTSWLFFARITSKAFTKVSNAVEFTFNKEDHTLGNLLRVCVPPAPPRPPPPLRRDKLADIRWITLAPLGFGRRQLLKDPRVIFAGYKMPHRTRPPAAPSRPLAAPARGSSLSLSLCVPQPSSTYSGCASKRGRTAHRRRR